MPTITQCKASQPPLHPAQAFREEPGAAIPPRRTSHVVTATHCVQDTTRKCRTWKPQSEAYTHLASDQRPAPRGQHSARPGEGRVRQGRRIAHVQRTQRSSHLQLKSSKQATHTFVCPDAAMPMWTFETPPPDNSYSYSCLTTIV